ncbi:hypothetical protein J2Y69_001197 [Microbacterium resistens]|uniref:Uncharacterized protein n=1 Tax=Microbacterium resistens TaxID=156977 RepID=A0ABU1SAG4_9MICO|nr:hypothetical protein [Microbacterium resistens]MDR6866604.1 hypothetical protein [Microbacterium resistens]
MPVYTKVGHVSPRLDRSEAKIAYLVDYINYLEQRIAALETR